MATSPEHVSTFAPQPDGNSHTEVFEDIRALKHPQTPVTAERRAEFVTHVLNALKQTPEGVYCTDINDVYRNIHEHVLVRREDPEVALEAVLHHEPIVVPFKDAQLNATEWDGEDHRSLRNPFIEGFSHVEGLVTVLGFTQGPELARHQPNRLADEMKDSSIVPERDVSISGTVHVEELRFLAVRIPTQFIPEEELVESERRAIEDGTLRYVFRGVLLNSAGRDWKTLH